MRKNNYTYVWVSLVVLVFGIMVVPKIVARIQGEKVVNNDRMSLRTNEDPLAYILQNGKKRRVPSFTFLNQDSLWISDKDYKGKVYIVEFFFTTCPSICPIMNRNLVSLQEEFGKRDDFGIASFSITPEYDTPSVLKAYAERYGITDLDWNLLTGEREKIHGLANAGFYIFAAENEAAPGGFEHSGLFALVDKKGFIRSRVDRFGNPIVYYRGMIPEAAGRNAEGETEQISMLREDIVKLLEE